MERISFHRYMKDYLLNEEYDALCRCVIDEDYLEPNYRDIAPEPHSVLASAFVWYETPQGIDYWMRVYNRLNGITNVISMSDFRKIS